MICKVAITLLSIFNIISTAKAGFDLDTWSRPKQRCVKYWEWTLDQDMVIDDKQYYGFQLDGSIGTFTLPLYDNIDLQGDPVARVRGSMITSPTGNDFTANTALYFYEDEAFLGVNLSFTYDPTVADDFIYGFTVGGTGRFKRYNALVTTVVVAESPKFTVEWEFCYDGRM